MRTFVKLVLPCVGLVLIGTAFWQSRGGDGFGEAQLVAADAEQLQHTEVWPHLDAPITKGTSVLWCGTFQLAWNEACRLVGEDLRFAAPEPAAVAVLNRKAFDKGDLDEACYVAIADYVGNDVHSRIRAELNRKFGKNVDARLVPPKSLTPRPQDIVSYSYLFQSLEFEVPFERLDDPLVFAGREVPAFGIGEEWKEGREAMYRQVLVWDFQGADDFVIELRVKSPEERVILAKVPPGETLARTIAAVQTRMAAGEASEAMPGDVVEVPKFDFDVTRRYRELEGLHLTVENPRVADDLRILSAVQNIRFEANEKGVRLRSEAHIAIGCGMPPQPPPGRRMVFDGPFLVMLQHRGAATPYFALWVDNPEILLPAGG